MEKYSFESNRAFGQVSKILFACIGVFLMGGCAGGFGSGGSSYVTQDPPEFDRTHFGNAPFPFWFQLTAPEIQALSGKEKAVQGDPEALLALAIMASGNQRETADYAAIRARVDAFVEKQRPILAAEKSFWQKGFKLHRAMHAEFFPPHAEGDEMGGYDFWQSSLTGIFKDGKFNCVSSSLLFLVLAEHFGMRADAVILTSHVFVQLHSPEGKIIEVETTTPSGFDWVHDESFYKKRAKSWFQSRGLPTASFADYQARRIAPPWELAAYNMNNQHTMPGKMSSENRCRLIEARGILADTNQDAQNNRLALYNSEYNYLSKREDWTTAERMFRQISPLFSRLHRTWAKDTVMMSHLDWLPYEYASTLDALHRGTEAFPWIDTALAWTRPEYPEGPALENNLAARILEINQGLEKENRRKDAERYYLRYPALLRSNRFYRSALFAFYGNWAVEDWEKSAWENALAHLDQQSAYAERDTKSAVDKNIEAAYVNWFVTYHNQGDWPHAREVLRKCADRLPESKSCRDRMNEMVAEHNLE